MIKPYARSVMILAIFLAAIPAGCRSSAKDATAVRFDGGSLTIEDLSAHREMLRGQAAFREHPERLTPEFIVDHAINMEMIIAKGLKERLHLDPRVRARIHHFMSDLFLKVMQDTLVPPMDREQFTEAEVRAYFDGHMDSYRIPPHYGVRLIRHDDAAFLSDLRQRIEAGQESFTDAARAHSTHAATAGKGGYAGKRALNRFRPEWRKSFEELPVDGMSQPVRIKDAYYLFQVIEKTEPRIPDYESKKAYVRNDLLYARYREAWRETYDRLRREFKVDTDTDALHTFLRQEGKNEKTTE